MTVYFSSAISAVTADFTVGVAVDYGNDRDGNAIIRGGFISLEALCCMQRMFPNKVKRIEDLK